MPRDNSLTELFPEDILVTDDTDQGQTEKTPAGGLTAEQLTEILENQRTLTIKAVDERVNAGRQPLQTDDVLPTIGDISMEGLPNPAMDFEGFHKGYMARAAAEIQRVISGSVTKVQERVAVEVDQKALLARAEQMIQDATPDVPQFIRDQAGKEVAASYTVPYAELQRDTAGVVQRVVERTAELVAELGGRKTATRTGGVLPARSSPTGRARPAMNTRADEKPGDLVKELQAIQHKARIY